MMVTTPPKVNRANICCKNRLASRQYRVFFFLVFWFFLKQTVYLFKKKNKNMLQQTNLKTVNLNILVSSILNTDCLLLRRQKQTDQAHCPGSESHRDFHHCLCLLMQYTTQTWLTHNREKAKILIPGGFLSYAGIPMTISFFSFGFHRLPPTAGVHILKSFLNKLIGHVLLQQQDK